MFDSTEKDVIAWHKDTFPNATIYAIADKFTEEMAEFISASKTDIFTCDGQDEFADMCIVYMAGLRKLGLPTLGELIRDKLEVNKKRTWGKETESGDRPRVK